MLHTRKNTYTEMYNNTDVRNLEKEMYVPVPAFVLSSSPLDLFSKGNKIINDNII